MSAGVIEELYVCWCVCGLSTWKVSLLMLFRSGTDEQYNEKKHLLGDVGMMKDDAEARNKALKVGVKIEKATNKRKADLRLAVMRQSCAGLAVLPLEGGGGVCG